MLVNQKIVDIELLNHPVFDDHGVAVLVKREDRIDREISGNKWWKLKYNIEEALDQKKHTLLTFGGAYSNHIASTAAAGKRFGLKTIGIIREELYDNTTLRVASKNGMKLLALERELYRLKHRESVLDGLRNEHGDFYLVPEGGANELGVLGCKEMLSDVKGEWDYICCPCGTGTTLAGLILAGSEQEFNCTFLGFSSLKGNFLSDEVKRWLGNVDLNIKWQIISDYHFGGYARINNQLVSFVNSFYSETGLPLDLIYTGKMFYGLVDMIQKGIISRGSRILLIHTGGLQGNKGFEEKLGMDLLDFE